MVLRWQDTRCQRLRDAGQGDEMAWFGRRDGSAAINLRLIDAFPEGVEVLGGWAEPWPLHGRWRTATAAAAMTLSDFLELRLYCTGEALESCVRGWRG